MWCFYSHVILTFTGHNKFNTPSLLPTEHSVSNEKNNGLNTVKHILLCASNFCEQDKIAKLDTCENCKILVEKWEVPNKNTLKFLKMQ